MGPVLIPIALSAAAAGAGVAIGAVTVSAAVLTVAATAAAAAVSDLMRPNIPSAGLGAARQVVQERIAAPANAQRSIPVAQPVPPRRFAYGPVRTGGALFFQDNENPNLYVAVVLSDGEIEAVDTVYFGEDEVEIDGSGLAAAGSRFFGFFELESALGTDAQTASAMLTGAFPTLTSDFRQRGVARAVVRLDWGGAAAQHSALWGQTISPSFGIRGVKVYDPREVSHDVDDPATWEYSDNPALCVAHALTNAWGIALPSAALDWDSVADAADVCDTTLTYDSETVKLFRCAGIFQADVNMGAQIADMLTSFRGTISYSGGLYSILADQARTSVWTIVDDDIIEVGEFVYATESRALFNAISASYYDAGAGGLRTSTTPYEITAAVTAEGLRETAISLPFTADSHSAQILAYRELLSSRDGRTLTLRLTDAALYLRPKEVVTISTTYATFLNGEYEVVQVDAVDRGATVVLKGYASAAYDNPATYLV